MNFKELAETLVEYQFKLSQRPEHLDEKILEQVRGEKKVLAYLIEIHDGVSPSKMADFLGVTTARVANLLNQLEEKGFIRREMDAKDRRKIIVYITDLGRETGRKDKQHLVEEMSKLLGKLGENDAKEHVRIMKKIYKIVLGRQEEAENGQ